MRSSVACAFWKAWAMQRLTKVKPTEKTAYLVGSHGTLAAKLQGKRQSKNAIMWLRKVYPATRDVLDVAVATAPPQSPVTKNSKRHDWKQPKAKSEGQEMKVPKRSASLSSGRLMSSSQESFCRVVDRRLRCTQ